MQLHEYVKKNTELIRRISDTTRQYSAHIVYPGYPGCSPLRPEPFASAGTFIDIDNKACIQTAAHVADWVERHDPAYVYLPNPWPARGCIPLRILDIIPLSAKEKPEKGVDLAAIVLDDGAYNSITALDKKLWNLDRSRNRTQLSESLKNSLFIVHSSCFEGVELKRDFSGEYYDLSKNAAPYIVCPELPVENYLCNYPELSQEFQLDIIMCIADKELSEDNMPNSFNGMSGAGLWHIGINEEIDLVGVAISEKPDFKYPHKFFFAGPIALYKSFYPYVLSRLHLATSSLTGNKRYKKP